MLTEQAKELANEIVSKMPRETLVQELENIGVACYDNEPIEDFIESYVDSIEAKDIEFDFSLANAKQHGHHIYMMWLDMDDIWQ